MTKTGNKFTKNINQKCIILKNIYCTYFLQNFLQLNSWVSFFKKKSNNRLLVTVDKQASTHLCWLEPV